VLGLVYRAVIMPEWRGQDSAWFAELYAFIAQKLQVKK
jgi:hypothetical protein